MISEITAQRANRRTYGGTLTLSYPNNVATGNLLIIGGAVWEETANVVSAITMSQVGGTASISAFTTIKTSTGVSTFGGLLYTFISYALVISGGPLDLAIAATGWISGTITFNITEFIGNDPSSALDVNGGSFNGSATQPVDTITTLTANDLIVGVMAPSDSLSAPITPGIGYTQIFEDETGAYWPYSMEYKIAGPIALHNVDWTLGAPTVDWTIVNGAFREYIAPTSPPATIVPARALRNQYWR